MTDTSPQSHPPRRHGGAHATRVIFIDLARALAVVFMLYGHTVDALLAPAYRSGTVFDVWQFQRGLTSSLFLLLSGFAFSIATARHWATHLTPSAALLKRIRRFAMFIALGYIIRVPVRPLSLLSTAPDSAWHALLAVDVLQLIGVTFVGVQLLVLVARSRRVFSLLTLALSGVVIVLAPRAWSVNWPSHLPEAFAAYFSPKTGSQFPLVPWSAFVLLGAALGQVYARWGASHLSRYANLVLLLPGALGIAVAFWLTARQVALFGGGPYAFVPGNIVLRVGVCLLIVGVIAHASRWMTQLPHVFGAVAQESLLIYVLHLVIVFGSVWMPGLLNVFGTTLTPLQVLPVVVFVISTMTLAAYGWNWLKHTHGRVARWATLAVFVTLIVGLI
jgi:uncharacterized membrane protein